MGSWNRVLTPYLRAPYLRAPCLPARCLRTRCLRTSCLGLIVLGFVFQGCGGATPAASHAATEVEAPPQETETWGSAPGSGTSSEAPASDTPASADDGLDSDIAALSASTQPSGAPAAEAPRPAAPAKAPASETGGREIVYRVTPAGLVIEIDGIHLRPEAKPFKEKGGTFGIELVVNAESFDGRQYRVNQPSEGPLSIAGKVDGKAGKSERFADQRTGSGEEVVAEGAPHRFKQRWPGKGQPKLWPGQTVTLEVGLWGVHAESERERPVRRLFVVKMVAGNKSPAVITPPAMDWGT